MSKLTNWTPTRRTKRGNRANAQSTGLPGLRAGTPESLADYLAAQGEEGTDIERILDAAAAEFNFQWDAKQYVIPLSVSGTYTRVDRLTWNPKRAVFPQGIMHYLRLNALQTDFLQDLELRDMGFFVFRPSYKQIYRDPMQVMQNIILCLESFSSEDPG